MLYGAGFGGCGKRLEVTGGAGTQDE